MRTGKGLVLDIQQDALLGWLLWGIHPTYDSGLWVPCLRFTCLVLYGPSVTGTNLTLPSLSLLALLPSPPCTLASPALVVSCTLPGLIVPVPECWHFIRKS